MSLSIEKQDKQTRTDLFDYLQRLGDDRLILGHRLSEWCGHGPVLEEDIALSNIALDCIGQAISFLRLAGEVEGNGRSEDRLAYFREAIDYKNLMLLEQPNTDFAYTMVRQFLYDAYTLHLYDILQSSAFEDLAAIAIKSLKEVRYHYRHSSQWMIRLGDGTADSHRRVQDAIDDLWMYTDEIFHVDAVEQRLLALGIAADNAAIRDEWDMQIKRVFDEATLQIPGEQGYSSRGSRQGRHSEHLGFVLAQMQILPRSYPNAQW